MMVQQNRNAIVSTLFLDKSLLQLELPCYQFFLYKMSDCNPLFSSILSHWLTRSKPILPLDYFISMISRWFADAKTYSKTGKLFKSTIHRKKWHLPVRSAFFIHPNIFLDHISLCEEAYIRILGFSGAYTFKRKQKKPQTYRIWTSSKTRKDLKSLDEPKESGFCIMFLIVQVM